MSQYNSALETSMVAAMEVRRSANLPRFDGDIVFPDHAGDFFSNDYLSISKLPSHSLSSSAQPVHAAICGTTPHHVSLERYFAQQFDVEAAMIFNGGYMANLTFFGYAPQPGDHNSLIDLEIKLQQIAPSTLFVVLESVYSMDGDFAPMEDILDMVDKYIPPQSAHIAVDEAHSYRALSVHEARVSLRAWGLEKRVHTCHLPLTKGVNFIGGVVTTTHTVYQYLSNYARSWLFATSLPHVDVVGIKFCFEVMQSEEAEELRKKVAHNAYFFMKHFQEQTREFPRSNLNGRGLISPVFPVHTLKAVSLQDHLVKYGYAAHAIVYPGVPQGQDRVRVVIHGGNSEAEIRAFVKTLRAWALMQMPQTIQARL
ncbi:PLP-dependent transferase [Coprinellus micaceus]|uniref:PLP-dependent transferase n=1 Tax=Coprinellus micaceus TaxID=71717 RepID=A0A4Y7SI15_COPMI|nr:PLP-dependent transferase [Coprinellus micaceus]